MKLNDVYADWSGLFSKMPQDAPMFVRFIAQHLDLEFFSKYGERPLANLPKHFVVDGEISDGNKAIIATIIYNKYAVAWKHLYDILSIKYDPIENYHMKEVTKYKGTETEELEKTGSTEQEIAREGSETYTTAHRGKETDTLTMEGSEKVSGNNDGSVYGFNSDVAVPTAEAESEETTSFENRANTNEKTFEDREDEETRTFDNRKDIETTSYTDRKDTTTKSFNNRKDVHQRSGNIGVTTNQQMIQSEIDLWQWNFLEGVYKDIASVMCLQIYEMED